jgi:hypothetical protein
MLLDPARGFCLAVEVTKEARVVIRPGYPDAPTVAALNGFQFGHLKVPRRGNVFRPGYIKAVLRSFRPLARWPPFVASVGYATFHAWNCIYQTNNKQRSNK